MIKMIATQLILISFVITTNALSIGTVSEQNVTKREANLGDLFPDWVPFKNKHGEELGEFVQVARKPKKRLAPPVNFVLRAVAESDDDYYEKGQGESDSDDYYEKKDWSDINRSPPSHDPNKVLNHTEISEIDGVVNIITKKAPNAVVEALQKAKQKSTSELKEKEENEAFGIRDSAEETKIPSSRKKARNYEDEIDYEDGNTEKRKLLESIDEDQNDNEAKKAILDTVDELKLRHAKEQVAIAEKAKEEEIYKEELERQKIQAQLSPANDKYDDRPKSKKKYPDYDEYDEKYVSLDEKYNVSPERTKPTTTRSPKRTSKLKEKKEKKIESGKLSVFKNPQLYIVYDDDSEETTTVKSKPRQSNTVKPNKPERFSAKYSAAPGIVDLVEGNERISLVPEENEGKEGEPTLFFPKRRKNKKRKKPAADLSDSTSIPTTEQEVKKEKNITTKAPVFDTISNETTATDNTSTEITGSDTTGSDSIIIDTTLQTGPSGTDAVSTNSDAVTDAIPASTHHHKEPEKKEENYHREKGGGREHHSEHEEEHSEEGKKAYEGLHKETKSSKGYHDRENHLGKYDDHGGVDKHHEEESGHYGDHHHEEHGKKHAKYEESGKHSKGHSTKGSHDIHKKEEYEKKVEFFEEEGDSAEEEKHGGFNEEHGHSKGGHFKNGNYKAGHEEHKKGDSGHFAKGGHLHVSKGHKSAAGHDAHSKKNSAHFAKEGKDAGKKWIYHHGYPPKTANLVLIDRRADQMYHGPQYYG
ncbi:uncharacterized protein LOC111362190 [Spodoptera litura]|uniref:Uncharacterized protein LOC111362190 n=1 Tax=Spodoptera litura TaxID=69820 RepID=A0A9J7EP81_SPOLT|nr:uncharacterized protein LOC111362190 [Spodoptera litura]